MGLHFRESSFKGSSHSAIIFTSSKSEIQLLERLSTFRSRRLSRPVIFEIKLWFRSSFLRFIHFSNPSITLISLNARMRVTKLVSPYKFSMILMLLLNRFKYLMYSKLFSRENDFIIEVVIESIFDLSGISGGSEFSIAALLEFASSS